MCGICGIKYNDKHRNVDSHIIIEMCNTMVHRGPDDQGLFIGGGTEINSGPVGLGIRRLAIIDLEGGHQPIHNENKTVWLVYNGEIYNFIELRKDLEAKGHTFYTKTDSEVIVHLYEEYNSECVKKLNGMFAFALWDETAGKLLLARDIFGIKPLFYSSFGEGILFSSEINSLLKPGFIKKEIDFTALSEYFSFYHTCYARTMFKGIHKLPPAHILELTGRKMEIKKYWRPDYTTDPSIKNERDCIDNFKEIYTKAIERHLISDVPVGVFLSGGLDSATIVAAMHSFQIPSLKTFSIIFDDKSFDESADIRTVAETYQTDHHEYFMDPEIYRAYLPATVSHLGEPNGDWTAVMEYYLAEQAKREVTVILTGTGGDEILAGYPTITAYKISRLYNLLPPAIRSLIRKAVMRLPVNMSNMSFDFKAKRFVAGADLEPIRAHMAWKEIFNPQEKSLLFKDGDILGYDPFSIVKQYAEELSNGTDIVNTLLYIDSRLFLGDCILPHTDASSMAHSVEIRLPYLDRDLVEFSNKISPSLKHRGITTKYLFRRAVRNCFPRKIVYKKKMGFSAPVSKWLRKELDGFVQEIVLDSHIVNSGLLNMTYVQKILEMHRNNQRDCGRQIQALVSFSLWYHRYM